VAQARDAAAAQAARPEHGRRCVPLRPPRPHFRLALG
jgi:hypothetical protein